VAISPSYNGQERTDAAGISILFVLLLKMAISPSFNGQERMDVTGTVVLVVLLP